MYAKFVFYYFGVYFLIKFTVVEKNSIHFFELIYYKIVLVYDGFHSYASAYKHLINCYKFSELFVVDHFLKLLYFVLQWDH